MSRKDVQVGYGVFDVSVGGSFSFDSSFRVRRSWRQVRPSSPQEIR